VSIVRDALKEIGKLKKLWNMHMAMIQAFSGNPGFEDSKVRMCWTMGSNDTACVILTLRAAWEAPSAAASRAGQITGNKARKREECLPHPFVLLLLGVEKTWAELSQVTAGMERPSLLLRPSGISNY